MEVPLKRKQKTIEALPHCESVFRGIEKYICRTPEEASMELHKDGSNSIRYYESSMNFKQQIPRIRIRLQCYPRNHIVIIDQLAVYDHECEELFIDHD